MIIRHAMPVEVGRQPIIQDPPRLDDVYNSSMNRVDPLVEVLGRLGIDPPAETVTQMAACRELLTHSRGIKESPDKYIREIADRVARGEVTPAAAAAQVQAGQIGTMTDPRAVQAMFTGAADRSYKAACAAVAAAAPDLLETLREALRGTLDAQAAENDQWTHPALGERYEDIHLAAERLYWALGGGVPAPTNLWVRFRRPEAVWAWRAEKAEEAFASGRSAGINVMERSSEAKGERTLLLSSISGVPYPALHQIAAPALRKAFAPDIVTAAEALAIADRLEAEQRAWINGSDTDATDGPQAA